MRSNREELLQFLDSVDYGHDYWADDLIIDASEIAGKLSRQEWGTIQDSWHDLTVQAQERLPEICDDHVRNSSDIVPMLIEMLSSNHETVRDASIESINSIVHSELNSIRTEKVRLRFLQVEVHESSALMVMDTLLRILSSDS